MGELRKRGRVWWIRYYRDGRRYEESARTQEWEVARDLLRTIEGDLAKGAPVSPKVGRLRFEDATTAVENEYVSNKRRSVADLKRRITLHLKPFFRGRRMVSITTPDVLAYTRKRLDAGAAPATVNRELAILKRMFTLALKAKTLLVRPHIPMLREDNTRTGFFEQPEFEAVRAELPHRCAR